jgi:dihydroxyacetone kinase
MLTAAVSGWVFASPSVKQIVSGISRIASSSGVLLIIKNYTGDIFHFHLAAEKARVSLGIPVEVLVVGDDVAVGRKKSGKVGRRGLAGTVLVHKILGARSTEPGVSLSEILALGKQVADNLVTVGASLEHVQVPGRTRPAEASNDQVEVGMGIHNETGSQVLKPRPSLRSLIDLMLNQLLDPNDNDRSYVDFSNAEQVILLVNNLGGLSEIEIGGITLNVVKQLGMLLISWLYVRNVRRVADKWLAVALRHILPARVLSGTYMTSLNGLGFSITLLKATTSMLQYIDAPTDTRGWTKAVVPHEPVDDTQPVATSASGVEASAATRLEDGQPLCASQLPMKLTIPTILSLMDL